jgi:sulfite reductase (NADPH) hemoprotein beta-component
VFWAWKTVKILTANNLAPGEVVYWNGSGWIPELQQAQVLQDAEAESVLKAAAESVARNEVVAPYLFAVWLDSSGRIIPASARELIRARGPSVRPDLGKQAA